jgi:predicted ATP-dependent serine protease
MTAGGLATITDPAALLRERSAAASAGACAASVVVEANRPMMIEIQALCSQVFKDNPPRRMVNVGLDYRRFDQTLAVLIKHARLKLYDQDVRLNVLGGLPATEPAVDAAMAAAIASSFYDTPLALDCAFFGELDLGGAPPRPFDAPMAAQAGCRVQPAPAAGAPRRVRELSRAWRWRTMHALCLRCCAHIAGQLRSVSKAEKRVAAAVNLGFSRVVAPAGTRAAVSLALRPHVVDCRDVAELVQMVRGKQVRRSRGKVRTPPAADDDSPAADAAAQL